MAGKDMDSIDLSGAMIMIVKILGGYGAYKILSYVFLLIIGAIANVANSGDITVPEVINNTTNTVTDSVSTGFDAFISAELIVLGLIALVVIIQIFWPLIKRYLPDSKGKGGNSLN